MFIGRKEVNFWPAYADMMFVLFILSFVIAIGGYSLGRKAEEYRQRAFASEKKAMEFKKQLKDRNEPLTRAQKAVSYWKNKVSKQEIELANLQIEVDKLKIRVAELERGHEPPGTPGAAHCGLAEDFVTKVMSDLEKAQLGTDVAERTGCGVELKEALLFDVGKAELTDRAKATTVVSILLQNARKLIAENSEALDSIIIEGHADCKGTKEANSTLGLERSQALFAIVKEVLSSYDKETQFKLGAYLSNRSFGEFRPLKDVKCSAQHYDKVECQRNRRVEITVVGRVGTHNKPNWETMTLTGNDD